MFMKKRILSGSIVGLAAALAGCVVTSVHPFFTQRDLVSEPALVGLWQTGDADNGARIEVKLTGDKTYRSIATDKEGKTSEAVFWLFKLGTQPFVDSYPANVDDPALLPLHQVTKVSTVGDTFTSQGMRYEWLQGLLTNHPTALRHEIVTHRKDDGQVDTRVVLTASTQDLQQFLLKHLKTEEAWEAPSQYKRIGAKAVPAGGAAGAPGKLPETNSRAGTR